MAKTNFQNHETEFYTVFYSHQKSMYYNNRTYLSTEKIRPKLGSNSYKRLYEKNDPDRCVIPIKILSNVHFVTINSTYTTVE